MGRPFSGYSFVAADKRVTRRKRRNTRYNFNTVVNAKNQYSKKVTEKSQIQAEN